MNGEDVVIMKAGKPCVRLMPIESPARQPGAAKAHAALTRALLDPLPEEEIKAWDGR